MMVPRYRPMLLAPLMVLPMVLFNVNPSVQSAPPLLPLRVPISQCSEPARQATLCFWEVFHGNDYDRVDEAITQLTAAWEENPSDATLTRLLGLCHLWKYAERARCGLPAVDVQEHAELGLQLFQKAQALDPNIRILPSFIETTKVELGLLRGDNAFVKEGMQGMRINTCKDPSTHGVLQGMVFSAILSEKDSCYHEAFDGFFASMDTCAGFRVPRSIPRIGPVVYKWIANRARNDSVCYNNDIAPHSFEATLLGMGDAYLKQGKMTKARMAYESARRSPNFACWPYKSVVEGRLAQPELLMCKFQSDTGKIDVAEPTMYFRSSMVCSGCHAR